MNESLEKSTQTAEFLVADLRAALRSGCTAVDALLLLPMIERAATLQRDIDALREAIAADRRA
jgi:hypothetical protein